MRLNPALAIARARLGMALQAFGDHDGAIEQLQEAVRLDRSSADARNSLGLALSQKGRGDEAVDVLRAADRRPPRLSARAPRTSARR